MKRQRIRERRGVRVQLELSDKPCDIREAALSSSHRIVLEFRLEAIAFSGRWLLDGEACVSVELAVLQN